MSEIAIKVDNVYKDFRLPHEKSSTLKSAFTNALKGSFRKKNIETQHALKGVSFEIKKEEFFGVVGRNGSGKSTLLKILAGIYQPTKGSVDINGRVVPFIELGVGFNAELSGRDNVYLNGAVLGFSQEEVDAKYKEIVEFAELERFMDQKLKNYSSGMQVRLAFSVATILADSDILLIDEVLAVGDASFQRKCFNYFKLLKKMKKTVVFVTHDMGAIREYCDKALIIKDGEVYSIGKPDQIADNYYELFNSSNPTQAVSGNSKTIRSGTGKVRYQKVKVKCDVNDIKTELTARLINSVKSPTFGFRVKSASGENILGNNSKIKNYTQKTYKDNGLLEIVWRFPNILSDGKYYLDLGATSSDGTEVFDKWNDAVEFSVIKKERTPYPVTPTTSLSIKEKKNVK